MKNKKIIASLAALSVLTVSSASFALNINGSSINEIVNNSGGPINVTGSATIQKITSNANLTLTADPTAAANLASTTDVEVKAGTANLGGVKVKSVKATNPSDVSGTAADQGAVEELPAEKQKCETLLYKQVS